MDISTILKRIDAHRIPLGMSDSHLSEAAGSRDLIRNWRRAVAGGKSVSARHDKLEQIATAMGLTLTQLLETAETVPFLSPTPSGFSEAATPFVPASHPVEDGAAMANIRAMFGPGITSPATFLLHQDLPGFFLAKSDVLIADMSRLPVAGEIALVAIFDDEIASATHQILRYLPPFLLPGDCVNPQPILRVDNPHVTVRYPVVASIRGITPD